MRLAYSANLLLLYTLLTSTTASDYRTCTAACSGDLTFQSTQIASYRACAVANSSAMYTALKRQLTGTSTVCGAALLAVAERVSNEVCEIGPISVPLCAESARTYLSAHCGNSAARTLLSQPPLALLAAGTTSNPTSSCAVMTFSPNASWLSWAGLLLAFCSLLLLLVGRHLERQGRWRSGATGQRVFTDLSWLSGCLVLLAAVFGALLSLGMASIPALTALFAPAVVVFNWASSAGAARACMAGGALATSVGMALLSSAPLPRLTPGAVTWLLMAPALWFGVLLLCITCVVVHTLATGGRQDALGGVGGGLAVLPCSTSVPICRSWQQSRFADPIGCLALGGLASLVAAVAVSALKAGVAMVLGSSVNGFSGTNPAAQSVFWITVLLAAGAGTAAFVGGARLYNLYQPPQATLGFAAGFVFAQHLLYAALWVPSISSTESLELLLGGVQVLGLAWACVHAFKTQEGAGGISGEPVGQGVPHRVALPDSSALPSLAALGFAGGEPGSLDTSMGGAGADVATPARKLLGWFNSAAGGTAGRRVGGVSYSRVGVADTAGDGGSGSSTPHGTVDEGGLPVLSLDSDEEGGEMSPLRGGAGASTGTVEQVDARGSLVELDVFDSDEEIDWSKA